MEKTTKVLIGVICLIFAVLTIGCMVFKGVRKESIASTDTKKVRIIEDSYVYDEKSARDTADWMENNGNGYSRQMIAEELKAKGFPEASINPVVKNLEDEDFSGQANMAIGWLKDRDYSVQELREILNELGFKKKDYDKLLKAEVLRGRKQGN